MKNTALLLTSFVLFASCNSENSAVKNAIKQLDEGSSLVASFQKPSINSAKAVSKDEFLQAVYDNQSILENIELGMQISQKENLIGTTWRDDKQFDCALSRNSTLTIVDIDTDYVTVHEESDTLSKSSNNEECSTFSGNFKKLVKRPMSDFSYDGGGELEETNYKSITKGLLNGKEVYNLVVDFSENGASNESDVIMNLNASIFESMSYISSKTDGKVDYALQINNFSRDVDFSHLDLENITICVESNDGSMECDYKE